MFGRTIFRALAVAALAVVVIGIGYGIYSIGVDAGLSEAARSAAGGDAAPVVIGHGYYGWGHGWGFGWGFGIFFWILGIFLIFGLVRAAFGGWRGGPRGYRGNGWGEGREGRFEEMHRRLHEREAQE